MCMDAALEDFASKLHFSVRERDDIASFQIPCLGTSITAERVTGEWYGAWFDFRTTSWDWPGERSDLNDITSSIMMALACKIGNFSCSLIDYPNEFSRIPSELYRRFAIPQQPENKPYKLEIPSIGGLLSVFHGAARLFHELLPDYCPGAWAGYEEAGTGGEMSTELAEWTERIFTAASDLCNLREDHYTLREAPRVFYYRAESSISVARDPDLANAVRFLSKDEKTSRVAGINGDLLVRDGVRHVIPAELRSQATALIASLEDPASDVVAVPFENAVLFGGAENIILLDGECGRKSFMDERECLLDRRRLEDSVLFPKSSFSWNTRIDGQRFEDFIRDLLMAEPFVIWVRSIGPARERDGGKDILARIRIGDDPNVRWSESGSNYHEKTVVIQCKATSSTVGTGEVREIRDVIEDAGAEGFVLATSSARISSALTQRLESIQRNNGHYTDWWDRKQLEDLLTRNPHVLHAYPEIVTATPEF
jgi:Restriction endonuclease